MIELTPISISKQSKHINGNKVNSDFDSYDLSNQLILIVISYFYFRLFSFQSILILIHSHSHSHLINAP